jgi:hypothetical protein
MSFNRTSFNLSSRRNLKLAFFAALTTLIAFSALLASAATKQRDASINLRVRLCQKAADGQWTVVDEAKGAFNFTASVADIASGKEIGTNHVWNVRSQKGRQLAIRLQRAGKVNLNAVSGLLALDLPFEVSVDGKKIAFSARLSTEQNQSPIGALNAKKAEINTSARTLTASVAGFTTIKRRDLIDEVARVGEGNKVVVNHEEQIKGKKEGIRVPGSVGGSAGINDELIVVIEGSGKATAKD